jgi:hypothetical protein
LGFILQPNLPLAGSLNLLLKTIFPKSLAELNLGLIFVMEKKNVVESGLNNALKKNGGTGPSSKSQFSISTEKIKAIFQRKDVIQSSVRISGTSGNYIREVDVGKIIGNLPLNKGGQPTRIITIITDKFGNLVNTFPGTLGRGGALK